MKICQKYNPNFSSLVHLWLRYVCAHVGKLVCTHVRMVCTHIRLVCTRKPLQGMGSTLCTCRSFCEAGNCEGIKKRPLVGETAFIDLKKNKVFYLALFSLSRPSLCLCVAAGRHLPACQSVRNKQRILQQLILCIWDIWFLYSFCGIILLGR